MWEGMVLNEKNLRMADEIVEVLIKGKCTVAQAEEILGTVSRSLRRYGTVQKSDFYETFKDDVHEDETSGQ